MREASLATTGMRTALEIALQASRSGRPGEGAPFTTRASWSTKPIRGLPPADAGTANWKTPCVAEMMMRSGGGSLPGAVQVEGAVSPTVDEGLTAPAMTEAAAIR
jgi:hypothetical protein